MSFETNTSNGTSKEERKYQDRNKSDDLQISRTDMNMLIMNYLVTGNVFCNLFHIYTIYFGYLEIPIHSRAEHM